MATRFFTILLMLGLLGTACSTGDQVVLETLDTESAVEQPGETPTEEPSSSGDLTADEAYELIFQSFEDVDQAEMQAQFEQEERERQQTIVACMTDLGFEYQAMDFGGGVFFGPGDDLEYNSREFAETYGFGFSTFQDEGFEEEAMSEEFIDPNQEYVEGLSDSARDAYFEALYGQQPTFDESMSEDEINAMFEENPEMFEPQGCEGEAFQETQQNGINGVYELLSDDFEEMYERIQSDPRVVAFETDWAVCMSEAGYTFAKMDDIYEDLDRRMQPVYETSDPFAGLSQTEIEAMTEDEMQAIFEDGNFGPDQELLDEVQEYEITLAVTSFDCGGFEQQDLLAELAEQYQHQLIEDNLATITDFVNSGE